MVTAGADPIRQAAQRLHGDSFSISSGWWDGMAGLTSAGAYVVVSVGLVPQPRDRAAAASGHWFFDFLGHGRWFFNIAERHAACGLEGVSPVSH